MCAAGTRQSEVSGFFFDPSTKCCTYIPALANFLVGRILADDDPAFSAGRATVEARLAAGVAVTPLGLGQPPSFALLYENTAVNSFGRSRSLRCPHYLEPGGRCGVWKHRASVCATWYCKHVRGATGRKFWQALHRLLSEVERTLAPWCVLQLDPGPDALERLFPPRRLNAAGDDTLDDLQDPSVHRALWGRWFSREVEFYKECGRLVSGLSWGDVTAIGGPQIQIFSRLAREAYGALMSNELPTRLKVGDFKIVNMNRGSCWVCAYADSDPLETSRDLLDILRYFDGRTVDQTLRSITSAEGVELDRALVRKLVDFEILVPIADRLAGSRKSFAFSNK
jgi:hypothetical protein